MGKHQLKLSSDCTKIKSHYCGNISVSFSQNNSDMKVEYTLFVKVKGDNYQSSRSFTHGKTTIVIGNNSVVQSCVVGNVVSSGDIYINGTKITNKDNSQQSFSLPLPDIHIVLNKLTMIDASGTGDIHIEPMPEVDNLDISLDGIGDMYIQGGVINTASLSCNGIGDLKARKLVTKQLSVDSQGTGDIAIAFPLNSLRANIKGVGDITLYGDEPPLMNVRMKGTGEILTVKD